MTRSLSRAAKSYRSLGAALFGEAPTAVTTDSYVHGKPEADPLTDVALDLLGGVAFPHLPATVSESSCSTTNLTRAKKSPGQHASGPETPDTDDKESKESYGWFVPMDDDEHGTTPSSSDTYRTSSSHDLAFTAATAPKRVDDDAEVQWAQAADTVDCVLGDFF